MTTAASDSAMTTLVIGSGPEENRLTDVRVMLPGLLAQQVHHLCLDLRACPHLSDSQLTELCRLQKSCQDRDIDLDLVGLDQEALDQLRATYTKTRKPRPAEQAATLR